MKLTIENLGVLDLMATRFRNLVNPDATPLMARWEIIIEQDNRAGILARTDKRGNPLIAVTYRPIVPKWDRRLTDQQRNNRKGNQKGVFAGIGMAPAGRNNNLTGPQYRRLDGPPLAPRGKFSRVITNLRTDHGRTKSNGWQAFGYWDEVVTIRGRKFLHYHFRGMSQAIRDLRGVRPAGIEKAKKSGRAWVIDIVRSGGA